MCCGANGEITPQTEANALELVKHLMNKYNISISNVVRHYDASRKICPNWSSNNWARWNTFKGKLNNNSVVTNNNAGSYRVRIIADVLNVRKGPSTNHAVVTTVKQGDVYTIIDESNGFLKLKSGAGWIAKNYTRRL